MPINTLGSRFARSSSIPLEKMRLFRNPDWTKYLKFQIFFQGSPGKYILISPPGENVSSSAPTHGSSMLKSPGHRRIREGKKCRKVYGLEQRDLWCTQCKWKKACARFGKPSLSATSSTQHNAANNSETSPNSLLIPAHSQPQNAVRAIKFWNFFPILLLSSKWLIPNLKCISKAFKDGLN